MRKGQKKRATLFSRTMPIDGGGKQRLSACYIDHQSAVVYSNVYDVAGRQLSCLKAVMTVDELRLIADTIERYAASVGDK